MDKVYLVYTENKYYSCNKLVAVCSDSFLAEKEKLKIEYKINSLKNLYETNYNSNFDEDLDKLTNEEFIFKSEKDYLLLKERISEFEVKHEELQIEKVIIEERELKN